MSAGLLSQANAPTSGLLGFAKSLAKLSISCIYGLFKYCAKPASRRWSPMSVVAPSISSGAWTSAKAPMPLSQIELTRGKPCSSRASFVESICQSIWISFCSLRQRLATPSEVVSRGDHQSILRPWAWSVLWVLSVAKSAAAKPSLTNQYAWCGINGVVPKSSSSKGLAAVNNAVASAGLSANRAGLVRIKWSRVACKWIACRQA